MMEEIKNIPQLPQVSLELIRHAFQDEPDIQLVASIVEKDPVFTAKLFKTVNSASFGLKVEVKSVPRVPTFSTSGLRVPNPSSGSSTSSRRNPSTTLATGG